MTRFVCLTLLLALARGGTFCATAADPFVVVLGIAQDAGYPQAACAKECCQAAWKNPELRRSATSIAIVDPDSGERWLIDCTPSFPTQLRLLDDIAVPAGNPGITGVFLTWVAKSSAARTSLFTSCRE